MYDASFCYIVKPCSKKKKSRFAFIRLEESLELHNLHSGLSTHQENVA